MSDLKRSCPACGAYTSDVGSDFRDGNPCRYCGLPAEAAFAVDEARLRGASEEMTQMAAQAEARASTAEREVRRLRDLLQEIGWMLERVDEKVD